ncbi:MAG: tyrosine--tRNA ligase [Candidatus Sungbacteria bacterium RIFCSPHIGHO2_02_FULL_49_20]|uniref:Tyrosine--tRNA ligase n=1 Tax=Candidatus Sungbacteria bacterium RIFCSPHIGHO2_02_FULL_49_20 TaxID=1802272 RepID=A0A1G2KND9_9BACT|nr:MAG: tyrosine--tRNA ligase [Candidatus Sungbacteria bacterium RIFCSPHIGHO2_02_FULL_49_20]
MKKDPATIQTILERNATHVTDRNSLAQKLVSGKKLRVKLGMDPTAPDLHIGNAVTLWKLREFQDAGHAIIFIIGDFTTQIGDPSGRSAARPPLTKEEISRNAKTYFTQVGKVLDIKKAEIRRNSEWLSKIHLSDWLGILKLFTAQRILERDDFAKRLKEQKEVWMHELMYPLVQAYDSVAIKADVEIGGNDQLFNLMAGRTLLERLGKTPQDILTTEILVGTDGTRKMSKSLGNYIGITESPRMMFGKTMSIPDSLIMSYFRLTTRRPEEEIKRVEARLRKGENPRDVKLDLASAIVELYHGEASALRERTEFVKVFSKKQLPSDVQEAVIASGSYEVVALLLDVGLARSKSEARRLIDQGGVEIIPAGAAAYRPKTGTEFISVTPGMIIRAGKTRFIKIR